MANVVIGRSDNSIDIALVLAQKRATVIIGVGIFRGIRVDQQIVVSD